ncbi:unspecified product [Leishmania tarentolae]|uniref:Unspecified product n=1 Tax=Leishmania tarentolae TaxID=5689 RepID=A0A640KKN8_LEITA|nr:unspecified product [Leishmania tarentolae]GET90286.1 unspecified product [Leishmania tarentolae]GET90290.1 unspecified product [Leishmania tarentolae]
MWMAHTPSLSRGAPTHAHTRRRHQQPSIGTLRRRVVGVRPRHHQKRGSALAGIRGVR